MKNLESRMLGSLQRRLRVWRLKVYEHLPNSAFDDTLAEARHYHATHRNEPAPVHKEKVMKPLLQKGVPRPLARRLIEALVL